MTDRAALARALAPRPQTVEATPQPKPPPRATRARRGLPARSPKRIAEQLQRERFREAVLSECGYRCAGPDRGLPERCGTVTSDRPALEVHEPDQRSTHPGSHVRSTLAVALCQVHHDMVTSPVGDMRKLALEVGLIVKATT